MVYWLYRIGMFLIKFLPERIVYFLADLLGAGAYYIFKRKRRVVESNLEVVFSENGARVDGIIRNIFCNYAHYYATLLRFLALKDEDISQLIELKGCENLEKALEGGQGAIIVTAHMGHWDLGGAALAKRFKTNVVVERLPSKKLFGLFAKFRVYQGMKVIAAPNLRQLLEALARNEVVVLLGDRDMDGKGAAIPFFGRITTMPRGAAALARKTGASVLPAFVIKESGREHYSVSIEKELNISKSESKSKDIEANTLKITQVIEDCIKMHPDNWYMLQPIWKKEKTTDRLNR